MLGMLLQMLLLPMLCGKVLLLLDAISTCCCCCWVPQAAAAVTSCTPAYLVVGVVLRQYVLLWLLLGANGNPGLVPVLALFGLLRMVLTGLIGILIVYAILSWVQPHSPIAGILHRLSEPLLRPLRKLIPLIGGVDLSALVAIIALQVLLMVLGNVQFGVLASMATGG